MLKLAVMLCQNQENSSFENVQHRFKERTTILSKPDLLLSSKFSEIVINKFLYIMIPLGAFHQKKNRKVSITRLKKSKNCRFCDDKFVRLKTPQLIFDPDSYGTPFFNQLV